MPRPRLSLRSPLLYILLLLLRETPAPAHYIAYYLAEDADKIGRYLRRLREYGLAFRDEYGFWQLTEAGREFIEKHLQVMEFFSNFDLTDYAHLLPFRERTKIGQKRDRNRPETAQKRDRRRTLKGRLTTLRTVLARAEQLLGRRLTPIEAALISYLYDFTRKTGRMYWWPPELVPLDLALAEELKRSSSSNSSGVAVSVGEVRQALRELEARGIIYITRDSNRGVSKVRISRSLLGDGE